MNAATRATVGTQATLETRSIPVESQGGKTSKRRASEAELDPSGAERKMPKAQQSRTVMWQELESTEGSDMVFELFYNRHLVMRLADYAAEPTMFSSLRCNHTMGFTVTGSMRDVCNTVYEYSVYPIQVKVCDFADGEKAASEREVVSWREMSRPFEKDLLSSILAEEVFEDIDLSVRQKAIRQDNKACKAQRPLARGYPVFILLSKYEPISITTSMTEIELLNAFLALIYCHAMLWSVGVEHGDISEGNLMYDKKDKKPKLCDFDLSHVSDQKRPSGHSNTGTWAFMAMELLTQDAMEGLVPRLYRHDFESFIAVLVWVVFRYRDGKLVPDPPLEEWVQNRFNECAANRKRTFHHIRKKSLAGPTSLSPAVWGVIFNAVTFLQAYIGTREGLSATIDGMEAAAINRGPDEGVPLTVNKRRAPEGPSLAKLKEELMGYDGLTFLDKVLGIELFSFPGSKGAIFTSLLDTHIDDLKSSTVS